MLTSKELRAKAWESLDGKYWMAFIVALITSAISALDTYFMSFSQKMTEIPGSVEPSLLDTTVNLDAMFISGIALGLCLIGLILHMLVGNIASLGCSNYFLKNTNIKPTLSDFFSAYKTSYKRNVAIMILRDIKTILWCFLLIIPGIIKMYEYAIIPFIIAEDNEISSKDAFKKAKQMMTGNKWRLFKLELSFIGWALICIPTAGIGSFFLLPYINAATAEFYVDLKNKNY